MSRWYGVAREPPRESRARPARDADPRLAGYSLVEILVALVITGIVGAGVVQLLLDQDRFYSGLDDRAFTEGSFRAAADLLGRELRAAAPSDLVSAEAASLILFQDSVRAAVCSVSGGDVAAYVYHLARSPGLPPGTEGTFFHDVEADTAGYLDSPPGLLATGSDGSDPKTSCISGGAPSGADDDRYVQWDWPTASPPGPGSVVHVHGEVTYRLDPSDFGAGLALWRNGDELIGPFTSESRFRYRMSDGSTTSDPGTLTDVRGILFDGRVRAAETSRDGLQRDLDLDITLRNRVSGGSP